MNKEIIKILCKTCKSQTNHEVITQTSKTSDNGLGLWFEGTWQVLQCLGCDEVTVREVWRSSEDDEDPWGEPVPKITLYPPRTENTIELDFNWLLKLPANLRGILSETIKSYNEEMFILCAAGVRAAIEGISADKGVVDGPVVFSNGKTKRKDNLEGKIEGLVEKGFVTRAKAEALHQLRFLGNEALHDLPPLTQEDLQPAIEIVKHVINNLYFQTDDALTEKAQQLQQKRATRPKRPSIKTSEQEEAIL